jgi:VWFA-related protein
VRSALLTNVLSCRVRSCLTFAVVVAAVELSDAQQVFRSNVEAVTIQVSVRSGNRPVAGLTAADFELRDNGIPQQIAVVSSETLPIDVTLLLDLSASVDGPRLQRLKTAVADTASLLFHGDRIRLVAVSQTIHEVFGFRAGNAGIPLDGLTAEGATSLYDGLAAAMMRPSEAGRRQLIVAFTDGHDSTSIIDWSTAGAIARLTDAVVDIVVPSAAPPQDPGVPRLAQRSGSLDSLPGANVRSGSPGRDGWPLDDPALPALSALTGPTAGQVFVLPENDSISRAFKGMLEDFRRSYVLQYTPRSVDAPGWHEVSVRIVKHDKYQIRSRKGYLGRDTLR